MRDRTPVAPPPQARPARRRRTIAVMALIAVAVVAAALVAANLVRKPGLPTVHGPPVRVADAGGDGVFLLTSRDVWRYRGSGRRNATSIRWREMEVDLWRLDGETGEVVWRRRLVTERGGVPTNLRLVGAVDDRLWVVARGPRVVRTTDGATLADSAALAATVERSAPALRARLPGAIDAYALVAGGVVATATNGERHRIDGVSLAVRPLVPGDLEPGDSAAAARTRSPAHDGAGATQAFKARGLRIGDRWLGVLAADEAERFAAQAAAAAGPATGAMAAHEASTLAPPPEEFLSPHPTRLWSARITAVSRAPRDWPADMPNAWGTRDTYHDLAPLPASPEFLQGGLLRARGATSPPIVLRDPDGLLVLHRDRLGDDGRLRLARVAGPDGRLVWDATLPIAALHAVLHAPAATSLVLVGTVPRPKGGGAQVHVASVDLRTGAVRAMDLDAESLQVRATP